MQPKWGSKNPTPAPLQGVSKLHRPLNFRSTTGCREQVTHFETTNAKAVTESFASQQVGKLTPQVVCGPMPKREIFPPPFVLRFKHPHKLNICFGFASPDKTWVAADQGAQLGE